MHVFITGASGFIGRTLATHLRAQGHTTSGVDRVGDAGLGIVTGDIATPGPWQLHARTADAVIHTAALVGMPSDESQFHAVNVVGTRNALIAARDGNATRFLHLSSVVTFGLDFPDGVDETHPVHPTGVAYTDTKIAAEQVTLMAHARGEQECTIIRPGDVYGPGSRPWTLLPVEMLKEGRFVLPAMGRGIHSPVYVDDLVDGIVSALTAPQAAGRVITLSGGVGVSTEDYFRRYADLVGARLPLIPTKLALAATRVLTAQARLRRTSVELTPHAVHYLADRRGTYGIATARELLGWAPATDLDTGFARTADWLRAEGLA